MSPISIKDIAQAAGVSHSTVSRALSDSPLVKAQTKARIQRLAHEMGYSPDARARSLVLGQSRTVGVVVTSIADPFIASVVQAIESAAHDHGYAVILASSNSEPEREIAAVEMLQSKRVDGVIVASSRVGALYQEHLERLSVPIVLINSHSKYNEHYTYAVSVDNRQGGYLATAHLVQLGHRRIAYVARPSDHNSNLERQEGYQRALTEAGLPYDPSLVAPCSGRVEGGAQVLPQLLALPEPPSAVFCYNDMTAIGLLHAAREAGLALPGDLAVVGFDDIPLASYVCPPLTTVAQPHSEMGRQAVQMTLALKQARDEQFSNIVLAGQLIIRKSSGVGN